MKQKSTDSTNPEKPSKKRKTDKDEEKDENVKDAEGTIEYVELVNFMCHKYLKISFGPKINFVIGQNGSGKSAILTALSVCLGARANFTNRGNSLKSLLKSGTSAGYVQVGIRNSGPNAFLPDVYGSRIMVERKIFAEGSASLKIMDSQKLVVSNKKETLEEIVNHFCMQIENPLAILTQDVARSFLATSTPKQRYSFFLEGTGLKQLDVIYETIGNVKDSTQNIMEKKSEMLPELAKQVEILQVKIDEHERMRELEDRLGQLRDELIWSAVEKQESVLKTLEKEVEKNKAKISSAQNKISTKELESKDYEIKRQLLECKITENHADIPPLLTRQEEFRGELQILQGQLVDLHSEEREIQRNMNENRATAKEFELKIKKELERLAIDHAGVRRQKETQIHEKEANLQELQVNFEAYSNQQNQLQDQLGTVERQKEGLQVNIQQIRTKLGDLEQSIQQLKRQKTDRLLAYGKEMPRVIATIQEYERQGKWRGKTPIGPFGLHVRVQDKKYSSIVETLLGNSLSALGVDNQHDLRLLASILHKFGCKNSIFKYSSNLFDYTRGEPDPQLKTLLRVLEVDNPIILRQLIINHRVEKSVLVESRRHGDELTGRGFPPNVSNVYTLDCFSMGASGGGFATNALNIYRGPPRIQADVSETLKEYEYERHILKRDLEGLGGQIEQLSQQLVFFNNQRRTNKDKLDGIDKRKYRLQMDIQNLKESLLDDEPSTLAHLQEIKAQEDEQYERLKIQLQPLKSRKASITEKSKGIKANEQELISGIRAIRDRIKRVESELGDLIHSISTYQNDIDFYKKKVNEYEQIVESKSHELASQSLLVQEAISKAGNQRVPVTKSEKEITREMSSIRIRLEARETEIGKKQDIIAQYTEKKGLLDESLSELNATRDYLGSLDEALDQRQQTKFLLRQKISIEAKRLFAETMRKRGYAGKLVLDHDDQQLILNVNVQDQKMAEQWSSSTSKDPKSLSGGEKSFSTMCLLISLWNAMRNPFRALDEFDVFMDAVNRRISMKLLIENARSSENACQYIFITPQDMSHVQGIGIGGSDVRIHRMLDPERGQTTLNF